MFIVVQRFKPCYYLWSGHSVFFRISSFDGMCILNPCWGAVIVDWLSSWLVEQEVQGLNLVSQLEFQTMGYLMLTSRNIAERLFERKNPLNKETQKSKPLMEILEFNPSKMWRIKPQVSVMQIVVAYLEFMLSMFVLFSFCRAWRTMHSL